jgi:hypothetical protein
MLKDYVLGTEVAIKGGFHIANISMVFNNFNLIEGVDYLKYGGVTLLSKKSLNYPKYIATNIQWKGHTDLSDLVPFIFFKETLENNLKLIKEKYEIVVIAEKKFVRILDKKLFKIMTTDKIVKSVVNNSELQELTNGGYILGHLKLSANKSLTWY